MSPVIIVALDVCIMNSWLDILLWKYPTYKEDSIATIYSLISY